MTTLKVGIIGTGGIVRTHMPGWAESPHAEVVAASDINGEALRRFGEAFDISNLTETPADLINNPDIDIIDICVPNNFHAPLAIAALNAGKHVLCEKPLAPTPKLVQDMIDARDASGKLLMTGQHFRFTGTARALKAEIDQGTLGDVYHARSWMLRRGFSPYTAGFVSKEQSAGGACIDIGVHILDLTLWMMGNPKPVTVSGVTNNRLAHLPGAWSTWNDADIDASIYDVEEMAAAFVRFENGATLILEVAWLLHHDTPGEDMRMWLYGDKGGSLWPKCEIYSTDNGNKQFFNRQLMRTDGKIKPHALECMEFAKAISEGGPSPVPAEQSLQVMTILDAIYESQATQREVVL
ncbi:MAG: Gfo/Idh/MocA family oxidoreductase [Anaerolineales bacterium]|nr:Gfo/Idh/MocA family oxidoreductase [Anaerolineales bacterium]MCB8963201.1 Gfo/Idh/MocA family oxidoreductase [Ardenticatenales bacterium]